MEHKLRSQSICFSGQWYIGFDLRGTWDMVEWWCNCFCGTWNIECLVSNFDFSSSCLEGLGLWSASSISLAGDQIFQWFSFSFWLTGTLWNPFILSAPAPNQFYYSYLQVVLLLLWFDLVLGLHMIVLRVYFWILWVSYEQVSDTLLKFGSSSETPYILVKVEMANSNGKEGTT